MLSATTAAHALRDEPPATAGENSTWDFTIKRGDGGSQVRELPCLLRYLHGVTEVGEVDGDFGPMTHGAVLTFQKRAGLDADGTVGPATWDALRTAEDVRRLAPTANCRCGSCIPPAARCRRRP
ncbi:hypothetical protein HHL19_02545 [Streptomyces sp. R302]|nr:hypothetical protein [Streptomyces sp. R301]NML77563.1 hypothetical protein [Streptomyces sp. R302]